MSIQVTTESVAIRRMAHASRGSCLRLPDRDDQPSGRALRSAFSSRRCRRATLGPRGICVGVAIQNLLWGIGQPFAGGIADRFGANRVMVVGAHFMHLVSC